MKMSSKGIGRSASSVDQPSKEAPRSMASTCAVQHGYDNSCVYNTYDHYHHSATRHELRHVCYHYALKATAAHYEPCAPQTTDRIKTTTAPSSITCPKVSTAAVLRWWAMIAVPVSELYDLPLIIPLMTDKHRKQSYHGRYKARATLTLTPPTVISEKKPSLFKQYLPEGWNSSLFEIQGLMKS